MRKIKIIAMLCIFVFTFTAFTACNKNNDNKDQAPTKGEESTPVPTKEAEETPVPTEIPADENVSPDEAQELINKIAEEVRAVYGEKYTAVMPYDEVSMKEYFGIESDLYDAYIAEGPMMTAHIDTFVAVHATKGNVQAVEDALNAFRDSQINDAFQYPSNMLKIQASRVETIGDYVFFVTLGSIEDSSQFENEEDYINAYADLNQLAIDAINSVLSK